MVNRSLSAKEAVASLVIHSPLAGFLSYLVPGLGQIYQGRISKGLLFFVCLYGLFFYGMWLGTGKATGANGHLAVTSNVYLPDVADKQKPWSLQRLLVNLYNRPQFAGQVWIGIAAWPAVWQYLAYGNVTESEATDAPEKIAPVIGNFERTPPEWALNQLQQNSDKRWDLGWVFTVIAGVLNVLVIYDAVAGPLFRVSEQARSATHGAVHA